MISADGSLPTLAARVDSTNYINFQGSFNEFIVKVCTRKDA